jgi:hypothetical protein
LIPLVGRQEEEVDDKVRWEAEMNIWGIAPITGNRKVFLVDVAVRGIGPQCVEVGDLVVVVLGCKVPLIFRKRTEEDGGGETVKDLDDVERRSEVFELH